MACQHQYVLSKKSKPNTLKLYSRYVLGKQTLAELSEQVGYCKRTLQRKFDDLIIEASFPKAGHNEPIEVATV